MSVTRRKAEFMLLLVTVCWAVSFPAIKIAASYASASVFVGVRFTLSTLLLLIFWFYGAQFGGEYFAGYLTEKALGGCCRLR